MTSSLNPGPIQMLTLHSSSKEILETSLLEDEAKKKKLTQENWHYVYICIKTRKCILLSHYFFVRKALKSSLYK